MAEAERTPPTSIDVMAFQLLQTAHDRNGNPRRHYVLYGYDGGILATIESGYVGRSRVRYLIDAPNVAELPSVTVTPSELKSFVRAGAENRGAF